MILALCLSSVLLDGCFTKRRPVSPMGDFVFAHPISPKTSESYPGPGPDIPWELVEVPKLVTPHSSPSRPRVTPTPAPETQPMEKPTEPIIAPELSDEQMATAKLELQKSLVVAERNLTLIQGKTLTATQQDVVSKIHGFIVCAA